MVVFHCQLRIPVIYVFNAQLQANHISFSIVLIKLKTNDKWSSSAHKRTARAIARASYAFMKYNTVRAAAE